MLLPLFSIYCLFSLSVFPQRRCILEWERRQRQQRVRRKQPTCSPCPITCCLWRVRWRSCGGTWTRPSAGTRRRCPSAPPTSRPCRDWWAHAVYPLTETLLQFYTFMFIAPRNAVDFRFYSSCGNVWLCVCVIVTLRWRREARSHPVSVFSRQ